MTLEQAAPHILVVDDEQRLRELLRRYLASNGFWVTTAADAAEARAKLTSFSFDLIVLDVMMPGENGLELTQALRRQNGPPILLLTAMDGAQDRIAGLERGADDYLAKPFEPRELLLRMNAILRRVGPAKAAARLVRLGDVMFDLDREELKRGEERVKLTTVEAGLLRALAANPGQIMSREALNSQAPVGGNARTVDVQVTRLRRKIEPDPRVPRYLHTVRGEGYVLRPDG